MKKKSNYENLLSYVDLNPNIIVEVGIKDGQDTLIISKKFKNSKYFAYEANPLMKKVIKKKLMFRRNVVFENFGLGEVSEVKSFFIFTPDQNIDFNVIGASSFYNRPDIENITELKNCKIDTLANEMLKKKINKIDILLMDVQGYELNVLKGAGEKIADISYVIMETPKPELIKNQNSIKYNLEINDYIGAPTYDEVFNFMREHSFTLVKSLDENLWETNSLFKNDRI